MTLDIPFFSSDDKPGDFAGRWEPFMRSEHVLVWMPFRRRVPILHAERTVDRKRNRRMKLRCNVALAYMPLIALP